MFSETAVSHGLLATPLPQCPIVQLINQKPEQFKDLTTCGLSSYDHSFFMTQFIPMEISDMISLLNTVQFSSVIILKFHYIQYIQD